MAVLVCLLVNHYMLDCRRNWTVNGRVVKNNITNAFSIIFCEIFAPAVIGNTKFRPNNWGKKDQYIYEGNNYFGVRFICVSRVVACLKHFNEFQCREDEWTKESEHLYTAFQFRILIITPKNAERKETISNWCVSFDEVQHM